MVCALVVIPATRTGAAPSSADATKKLKTMEGQMATAQKNYQNASSKLAKARTAAAKSREELKELNARIDTNRKSLNTRANYLYRAGNTTFIDAVFSSQSFAEVYNKITMLNFVTDSNARVLDELRADLHQRTVVQDGLEKDLKEQETQTANLKEQSEQASRELADQQAYVNALSAQEAAALEANLRAANNRPSSASKPESKNNPSSSGGGGSNYSNTGTTFDGLATWYGTGRGTASGEPFNPNAMTAAHKTLPFGTLVRVTYKGRSVVVRINDRGPYAAGRVIDLTRAAAEVIGLKSAGVGYVTCEIVR